MRIQPSTPFWTSPGVSRYAPIIIGIVGLMLRLAIALASIGSSDMSTWHTFAQQIDQFGLGYMYANVQQFNHPPLMGYFAQAVLHLAQATGISFAFLFKLPMIGADLLTLNLLWKIWQEHTPIQAYKAIALFGVSLIAILISAYHGNTDSLCASLCLLAAYCHEKKRPLASGIALAAALNVKLVPIVLIPAFLLSPRPNRDLLRFGMGLLVGAIPFAPFFITSSAGIMNNVINYIPVQDRWGILYFLSESTKNKALEVWANQLGYFYAYKGRYLVLLSVLLVAIWHYFRRNQTLYEIAALCFTVFLIFAPGFGIQYLVYLSPLLFAVNLRWAAVYSGLAGFFALTLYYSFWTGTFPWYSNFNDFFPTFAPLVGVLTWGWLIQFAFWSITHPLVPPPQRVVPLLYNTHDDSPA